MQHLVLKSPHIQPNLAYTANLDPCQDVYSSADKSRPMSAPSLHGSISRAFYGPRLRVESTFPMQVVLHTGSRTQHSSSLAHIFPSPG
eukprot:15347942-Ditylum_brightwellii.AAC.1